MRCLLEAEGSALGRSGCCFDARSTDPVFIQAPHQRLRLLSKGSSTSDQSDRQLIDSGLGCSSDRGACRHRMQPTEPWCRSSGQARLLPSLHWVWSCENAFEEDSRLTQPSLPIVSSPAILQQSSTPRSFSLVVRRVPPQPQHTTPAAGKIGPAEVTRCFAATSLATRALGSAFLWLHRKCSVATE